MIFGQTIFQSVLERLEAEGAAQAIEEPTVITIRGLNTGFVAAKPGSPSFDANSDTYSTLHSAYFAFEADDSPSSKYSPEPQPEPVLEKPAHLDRLRLAEIARDLDLNKDDTLETLARKRRAFAQDNHPDVTPAQWRESANVRMKLANLLIDEAQKLLLKQG